jgi:hypothetical protein
MSAKCPHCGQDMPEGSNPPGTGADVEKLRLRICGWFKRRFTTAWTEKERASLRAVAKLAPTEADLILLDGWFADRETWHRKDVQTLLNNWNAEIDRARDWAGKKTYRTKSYAEQWAADNAIQDEGEVTP